MKNFVVSIFIGLVVVSGIVILKMGKSNRLLSRNPSGESINFFVRPKLLEQLEEIATVEVIALMNNRRPLEVNQEQVQELKDLVNSSQYPASHWLAISRLARIYHKTQPDGYKDELAQMLKEKFTSCHGHFNCLQMTERLFELTEIIPTIVIHHLPKIKKKIDQSSFINNLINFSFQTIDAYAAFLNYTDIMNSRSRLKVNKTLGVSSRELKDIRIQLEHVNGLYKNLDTMFFEPQQRKDFSVYIDLFEGEEKALFRQFNPDVEISQYLLNYIRQKMIYLHQANRALHLYTQRYEARNPIPWLSAIKEKTELPSDDPDYLSATEAFWLLARFCHFEFELPYRHEWMKAMSSLAELAWQNDPEQEEDIKGLLAQKQEIYENINNFYQNFFKEDYGHLSSREQKFIKKQFGEEQEKYLFDQGGVFLSFLDEALKKIEFYVQLEEVSRKYKESKNKKERKRYEKKYYQLVDLNSVRWLSLQCSFMVATSHLAGGEFQQTNFLSYPHWRRTPIVHENYSMREACYFYGTHLRKLKQFAASPTISEYTKGYITKLAPQRRMLTKVLNSTEFQLALGIAALYMTGGTYTLILKGGKTVTQMLAKSTAKKASQKMAKLPPSLTNATGQALAYMGKGTLSSLIYTLMHGSLALTVGNKSVFKYFGDYYTYNAIFYLAYPAYMKVAGMAFQRASVTLKGFPMSKKLIQIPALKKLNPVMNHSLMRGFLSVNHQALSYLPVSPMVAVVDNVLRDKSKKYWKNTEELGRELYANYLYVIFARSAVHLIHSH